MAKNYQLLYSDETGHIFESPDFLMAAFDGRRFVVPPPEEFIPLARHSKLFALPDSAPVGWSPREKKFGVCGEDKRFQAVSAFLPPGFVRLYHPACRTDRKKYCLPLWAYSAVGFAGPGFHVPAVRIDSSRRWQPEQYDDRELIPEIKKLKKIFRKNRLVGHLERCAVSYHCFNAKNLFLGRWEAPLPISRRCNSSCLGCISFQKSRLFPASHERISFKPTVKEIAELAIFHLERAQDAIVSFGQGCEGEPLLEFELMADAIGMIRKNTFRGVIHLNTNGSCSEELKKLCDRGLDSVRISLSSSREALYSAYYQPSGYSFQDVLQSIRTCSSKGIYTAVNYLVFPGITDETAEWQELKRILNYSKPHFIHLRNLNIDPFFYLEKMAGAGAGKSRILGLKSLIDLIRRDFPGIKLGYFNPSSDEISMHMEYYRKFTD
jgi:wyosine [tRNA(Phe)-imidazoG37] synthetase (radical SAM superfamily)